MFYVEIYFISDTVFAAEVTRVSNQFKLGLNRTVRKNMCYTGGNTF